jgi:uncharacterized protein YlaI
MEEFNRTQQLNVDDLMKSIPVICSWCNKIYHIKQWQAEKGTQAVASHGMCPECEKKQKEELQQLNAAEPPPEPGFNNTIVLNMDDMPKTIPIICAWCNKIYHIQEWKVEEGKRTGVSHGMCPECEHKQNAELAKLKADK